MRSVTVIAVVAVLLAASESVRAQDEQFRERQVLDPDSDAWVDAPPTQTDPTAAELDEARSLLARGEPRAARKRLEDWMEANPDHPRYTEALYLLGETYFAASSFWKAYERFSEVSQSSGGEMFYKAIRRQIDVARAFLSGKKRIVLGFLRVPAYDDGVEILDRVWEQAPGTRYGEESLRLKADYFFDNGDMDLAQDEYVALANEYPNGRYIRQAMLRSAEAAAAAYPGVPFDDRALLEAEARYSRVQDAFPDLAEQERIPDRIDAIRQQRAEKDLYVAKWYERTRRTDAAAFYYKLVLQDWPDTLAAIEARSRLRALGVEVEALPEEAGS